MYTDKLKELQDSGNGDLMYRICFNPLTEVVTDFRDVNHVVFLLLMCQRNEELLVVLRHMLKKDLREKGLMYVFQALEDGVTDRAAIISQSSVTEEDIVHFKHFHCVGVDSLVVEKMIVRSAVSKAIREIIVLSSDEEEESDDDNDVVFVNRPSIANDGLLLHLQGLVSRREEAMRHVRDLDELINHLENQITTGKRRFDQM